MRRRSRSPSSPDSSATQRFVLEGRQMGIAGSDVRWIAHDQIEAFLHAVQPVRLPQLQVEAQFAGVCRGNLEGCRALVRRGDGGLRPVRLDRQRDRAAAGAQIDHMTASACGQQLECPFDQRLRVGTRNEHAWIHAQRESEEFASAGNVRQRFAADAAAAQRHELLLRLPHRADRRRAPGASRDPAVHGRSPATAAAAHPGARAPWPPLRPAPARWS